MPDAGTGTTQTAVADKRRAILDAAIRISARQVHPSTLVADIAAEAGAAYGLVDH